MMETVVPSLTESENQECIEFLIRKSITTFEGQSVESFFNQLTAEKKNIVFRLCKGDKRTNQTNFMAEFMKFPRFDVWKAGLETPSSGNKRGIDLISSEVFLFWKEFQNIDGLLVIRKQTFGLCFMHAPVVLQHYLVTIATNGQKNEMIDIGRFEADKLTGGDLREYILGEQGGDSVLFLSHLCGLEIRDTMTLILPLPCDDGFENQIQIIKNKLKSGLPAMISSFQVYSDFFNNDKNAILRGTPKGSLVGFHAMILIGMRTETDDAGNTFHYFLIQNWWDTQYFVEVDAEYLGSCRHTILFVKKVMYEYSYDVNKFSTLSPYLVSYSSYAETSVDKRQTLLRER